MNADEIIRMACNGNADAESFCRSWVAQCHLCDDCFDRDRPVTDERIAAVFVSWLTDLCGNRFFLEHKPMLFSLMVVSVNSWLDSNGRTGTERAVLSACYHEIIYCTAYLCGGWSHLRRVTSEVREYKQPTVKPVTKGES